MKPGDFNTNCRHPRAHHRHGTVGSYRQDGCRCTQCREANRRDQIMWQLRPNPKQSAAPTAARLRVFHAAGWTWTALAARAGCTSNHLARIAAGQVTAVTTATAKAVAAIPMCDPPTILVARRLQALAAIGWTAPRMAALFGVSKSTIESWRTRGVQPQPAMIERIKDRWDTASVQPQTGREADIARTIARKNGWAPPAAWDDIDNPYEHPEGVRTADLSVCRGEDIVWLLDHGETIKSTAQRLGITEAAVERARLRHQKKAA